MRWLRDILDDWDPALIIFGSFLLFAGALLGVLLFFVADSVALPVQTGEGVVVEKQFSAAYTTVSYMTTTDEKGNTSAVFPMSEFHPERHALSVGYQGSIGTVVVPGLLFDRVRAGQAVAIRFSYGRFTDHLYIWEADDVRR